MEAWVAVEVLLAVGQRPCVVTTVLPPRCAVTAASTRWTSATWRQLCGQRSLVGRPTRHHGRRLPGSARWSWSPSTMMWTSVRR